MRDDAVLDAGLAIETALTRARPLSMRIAVVGAGIIGVTTAYELSVEGHEVTVFERRAGVAAETSFANAGLVAPGYVTPWAAPGMPGKVLRHLFSRHAPVRLHAEPRPRAGDWHWWRACRPESHQANRLRMQRLAFFSRDRLQDVTRHLRLEYEHRAGLPRAAAQPRRTSRWSSRGWRP